MSSNAKEKIVLRGLLLLFILVAFMALPIAITIAQEVPAHVVISEVFYDESGTDNNEFCELYNPSDSDINIGNWKLKAFNQSGTLKTTTTLPVGTTITAHKFYLIGEKDPLNSTDWGGTAISPDCLRGGIDWQNGPDDYLVLEDSTGTYVDGVRWGHSTSYNPPAIPDVPDNHTAPDVIGESIERKSLNGGYAPCQDTDDNSFDFFVQNTPTPKNTSSAKMDPAPVELFDAAGNFKGGFNKIQDAVDNASDGYTILVHDGAYNENVDVNKRLTIRSENGSASTIVNASDSNDHVFEVTANWVNISGFTVQNATENNKAGVYLGNGVEHCNISDNKATNNYFGICLWSSDNNNVTNNTCNSNGNSGIYLEQSNSNTVSDNVCNQNTWEGIWLDQSNNNAIYNNAANLNNRGIDLELQSNDNIVTNNTCNSNNMLGISLLYGNPGNNNFFADNTASDNNDYDFYSHEDAYNNTVEDLTIASIASFPTTISFTYANGVGLKGVEIAPGDPAGKANIGKYVNATDVTLNSWIFMNVSYGDADLDDVDEDSLRMWRYNGIDWTEVPAPNGVNTVENYVYANITSFSIFAPLGNVTCAKLEINKTGVPDPVLAGGTLNYSISVNNTGNATATNVTVKETYDGNVTFVTAVPAPSLGNDTWEFATLNASETRWINVSVTVNASVLNGTVLHNIVNVTCDEGVTDSDTADTTVLFKELNCTCGDICVNTTGWWRAGSDFNASGTPIQAAIDNTTAGETICVKDGTYHENVDVTKSHLTIRSEFGPSVTTVSASLNPDDHVFDISDQTDITLEGFEIRDAHGTSQSVAGIYMYNASECNISGNIVTNISATGIYDYACGIWLEDSSDNSLSSNTADSNNDYGILLSHSSDNSLSSNTADSNNKYGISLSHSSNNTLIGNNASKNHRDGIYLYYSDNNKLIGNNASNNNDEGINLYYSDNNKLTGNNASNNDFLNIYLDFSNNNTLTSNTASNASNLGILLGFSSGNTLTGNNASNNNGCGISVRNSYNNTFTDNTASNNRIGGIYVIWHSSSNTFTDNTALNNTLWWDFYSDESSHDNTIEDLTIASYPTTISFIYDNGIKLKGVDTAPDDPAGKMNISKYVNATEVTADSWLFLNVSYEEGDLGGIDENSLRMWRYNGTDWTEVPGTNGVNTAENYVYANITEFSVFAPLGNVTGAKLEINKTGVPDPVSPGGTLNYSISVNNTGNATATNVTVKETYDGNVTFVAAVPAPSSGNDTWQFPTLNVSEMRGINISVTVNASVLNGTVLHNIVNVTCDEGVTDTDTADTTVLFKELNCTCGDICVNETGWWRDGGAFNASNTPIQHAIDNATAGETICVKDGTYNENVDVNVNNLIIKSESSSANCIVNASNPGDYVFEVTGNYVNISGFTIEGATGAGGNYYAGIYLDDNIHNCMIAHNTIVNNNYGIWLHKSNHDNTLTNNNVSADTITGISLARSCTNNRLTNNIASGNQHEGIMLAHSSNYNTLTNNTANSNDRGIALSNSHYNTLTNNTANSNTHWNGIILTNSNDNVLERNTCLANTHGIMLDTSNRNMLEQNNCSSNYNGFIIISSRNNALRKNTANLNGQHGIFMYREWAVDPMSNFNTLINNSVSNNTKDGIHLNDAQYNNLTSNAVNGNNIDGISLGVRGSRNNLTGNTVTGNSRYGIWMESAHYNNLTRNTVNANTGRGIYMRGPSNNNMLYNNYFNNTNNAYDEGDNTWNITKEAGTNIIGGPYLGGNYWSDYRGKDLDEDGLGDTLLPYNSSGNIQTGGDWHPLTTVGYAPPEIISFAPPSPVNDTVCNWRTFNVTVNQTVNVSWYLNNTLQHTNESTKEASYTLHAEVVGEHNVSAIASNVNGTDMQSWVWNVTAAPLPVLGINKTGVPDPVSPGGTLNYTISVNNKGNATATNVTVMETYDKNVTFDTSVPAPSSGDDTWQFQTLNVSETRWINISVTVNASVPNGTVLHNIVNVSCAEGVTDSDTADTTVLFKELNCTCGDLCVNATGWWHDGGAFNPSNTPIQHAVDNATAGDTLCVKDGTYTENVDVNKSLTIRSEHGSASTTVQASNSNDHVFEVTADYVNIRGFTVTGAIDDRAGIYLSHTGHCNISGNNASDNFCGIWLSHSGNNSLSGNTADSNNHYGIRLYDSSNYNSLSSNIASNNDYGILLDDSSNNSLSSNTANWNRNDGIGLYNSSNYNSLTNNTASNNDYGILLESHSSYNSLSSNTASNNDYGIGLYSSSNNSLMNNTANWNNDYGIYLFDLCNNNLLTSNTASNNNKYGIHLYASSNNWIYNNYFNNTNNAYDDRNNVWNTTKEAGTNIIGGPYLGGNYWSDYSGKDLDGDGLGDTLLPYNSYGNIQTGGDWHPLTTVGYAPPEIISFAPPSPVNDTVCNWRTFNVTVNQTVNVSWYLNNTLQHTNESTKEASYSRHAEVVGEHNVSAIASNENGTDMQTWVWNVTAAPEPVLEITKSDNPDPVLAGGALNYTIHVNNTGNATATNVTVMDTYDKNVTFVAAVPTPSSGDDTWQFPTLNVSKTIWINISVTVNASVPNGTVLHNIVNVSCDEGVTDSDTENTTVFVAPALPPNITSFAPPSPVNDTVCNWRTFNVTVDQTVNVSWYLNNTLQHTNVSTKEANYTLHAEVVGEHNVSAIATNGNGTDMQSWVWNVTAAPEPVLEITKTDVPDPVSPAGALNYTIRVNNAGNATATNVTVKETYDTNVTFVAAEPAPSSGDDTWQFPTLNVSETRRINISVNVNASVLNGTILHNIVNVTCDEGVMDSDTEDTTVFVAPVPVLEINKTGVPDPVSPGGTLNYTISVNNVGNATATNVAVMETYDENVTFVAAEPAPSSGDDTWQFPTLNASETRWINISVTVNVSVPNGTVLHNIVTVSCDEGVTDSDTEDTTVFAVPVCVETATDTGIACFATDSGTIEDLVAVDESTLPEEGKPELVFPHGFFSFNITGLTQGRTVVVTITLPDNVPVGTQYWKYHAAEGGWIRIQMGSDDGDNVITITLVDGGLGDDDGIANGVIVDQGGPGIPGAPPVITSFAPPSPVNDTVCNWRTFNVTVDQTVNVSWYLNNTLQHTNVSTKEANYSLHAEVVGEHNVSAIASNANGTDMQSWVWNVTAAPEPVLEINKSDNPDPVLAGGALNYTIHVNNTGNATAINVIVKETYDANVTFIAAEPAPSSGDDTWQFPTLNVSETRWINISVTVNSSVPNGTVLHNIVNVTCDEGVTGSDTEDTTVFVAPALPPNITSFAPPSPVNDTVCNWRTFNVTVDQTVNVSWYLNNTLRHTNVSTKEASYTLHAEVVGEHNVSAIATNGNGRDMQTWVWNVTAAPEPVLEITKTDVPDPVSPSGALNYTIRVNNAGNATATNVTVKETYDTNVTFVAAEPAPSSGDDMWQFATLNASEMRWINISVTVNASVLNGTVLHNIVNVSCDEGVTDTDTENTTVFVAPVPVLEITKTDAPDPVSHGGTLNYTISVNNTGNGNATNVTVMETYDKNVTFVAAEPAPSSGDDMWQFPTLNVSETRWINISVIVNASVLNGTVLHNIVNVSCAEGVSDTDTENTTVFVAPVPVLEIAKTDAPDPVSPGGSLNYSISVNNTGNGNATNVTVIETYDKNVTFVAAVPAPSSGDDTWQFPTLNASEMRWINISVIVNASVLNGTVLHNIVNVSCAEGVTDTDTENTTVFAIPSIANVKISKWVKYKTEPESEYRKEIEDARVCNNVSFKIAVQNNGTGTNLTGISVTDVLNCSLGYINDSANIPPTIYENNCPANQTLLWQFATLWLEPGKYINITFDAHVDECGNDRNYARVDAISGTGCNVSDEDYVYVNCTQAIKPKLTKSAPTSVAPGGTITYTVLYANVGPVALTDVTITENYPEGVTFSSADPAPDAGTNNKWTIGTLPAGSSGQIIIKVKVPDSRDLSFTETGSVTGEGLVMVSKDLSTEQKPYRLKNVVTITCAETDPVTASASTTVSGVPGTSLEITEHGSGIYESEEILNLETKNKSIRLQKSTEAEYQPTSFYFSDSFSVVFTNMWMQDICSKNMVMGDAMHKKIKDATYIKDDTKTETGEYGTEMEFASSFHGAAHIGAVSKDVTTSEDYIGEFEIFWAAKEECQYLFNWSRVPGDDSEKLIRFLVDNLAINWAENATITKSDDDRIINISTDWRSAEVILAADNETATVEVGGETIYVLDVRTEDSSLNVYDCRLRKISESVAGEGYVMVDKELASGHIQVVEHGSGIYSSDTDFDSQRLNKSTEAEYRPTTFNFSDGFGVNFSSNWMQGICSKDKKAGTAIHKKISDAVSIADDTTATKSSMAFETSFNGSIHIGARTTETRISEDYIGQFNVSQVIKIGDARSTSTSTSNTSNSSDMPSCP